LDIVAQLVRDEGLRLKPYSDTEGKLTIGIGRNLTDVGISVDEAHALLSNDVLRVQKALEAFTWYTLLDDVRKAALVNMAFNIGVERMFEFTHMLTALRLGNWGDAADEMLDSKWASQVGDRAKRLAQQIRTGEWQ
jgi:lysozyme